jgi:carboxyl-terminal processing protease
MRRRVVTAALASFLCAAVLTPSEVKSQQGGGTNAARTDYARLFDALWKTVNENYFDPNMNGVDFAAVRERYRPQLSEVRTDEAFLDLGNKMIRELKSSHLDVLPPPGFWERHPSSKLGRASSRLRSTRSGLFYYPGSTGSTGDLRPGDEILSPPEALTGPLGSKGTLRVRGCDGRERDAAITYSRGQAEPYHQRTVISGPDGRRVAYAKILRFNDDTIGFADELIAGARDTDGMIIDVRDNSGGSITALYLANYFATGSQPTVTLASRPVLARLGRRPTAADLRAAPRAIGKYRFREVLPVLRKHGWATFYSEGRGPSGYRKPVTVLINSGTGSAAEGFAWMMKGLSSAKLVGRPTAGALLRGQEFQLPYGWEVTVPVFGLWGPEGQSFIDAPAAPDLPVEWTRADFCANRDADITAAMGVMFAGAVEPMGMAAGQ